MVISILLKIEIESSQQFTQSFNCQKVNISDKIIKSN